MRKEEVYKFKIPANGDKSNKTMEALNNCSYVIPSEVEESLLFENNINLKHKISRQLLLRCAITYIHVGVHQGRDDDYSELP